MTLLIVSLILFSDIIFFLMGVSFGEKDSKKQLDDAMALLARQDKIVAEYEEMKKKMWGEVDKIQKKKERFEKKEKEEKRKWQSAKKAV